MADRSKVDFRKVARDGALAAAVGGALVLCLLSFDVLGIGSLVIQSDQALLYLAIIVVEPMMFFGTFGAGLSLWKQLGSRGKPGTPIASVSWEKIPRPVAISAA